MFTNTFEAGMLMARCESRRYVHCSPLALSYRLAHDVHKNDLRCTFNGESARECAFIKRETDITSQSEANSYLIPSALPRMSAPPRILNFSDDSMAFILCLYK
jgi:hypothetical protein